MLLYHGSNVVVEKPRLIPPKRLLDFGAGFYLTSDFEQARKWASRTVALREDGQATVSVYDVCEEELQELVVLSFDAPNREWLRFVAAHRTGRQANGNMMPSLVLLRTIRSSELSMIILMDI